MINLSTTEFLTIISAVPLILFWGIIIGLVYSDFRPMGTTEVDEND